MTEPESRAMRAALDEFGALFERLAVEHAEPRAVARGAIAATIARLALLIGKGEALDLVLAFLEHGARAHVAQRPDRVQ
jgi:hypothetical protein